MSHLSARAPGRVELLGNHTDYNEGVVLAAAINHAITVSGEATSGSRIVLRSTTADQPVDVPLAGFAPLTAGSAWANYALGVVACLQQEGYPVRSFSMEVDSDLPVGAGLSSSAALEVATARLLMKMYDLKIEPLDLAKLCRRAENEFVGVQCGLLDQVSSIFGRRGTAVYLVCRSEAVENIPLPPQTSLLVFQSGVEHQLTGGEYNERREQCFAAARALGVRALRDVDGAQLAAARSRLDPLIYRRAAHIVGEDERVFAGIDCLRWGDGAAFGALMFASHESSRLNFENSTPELDVLVELARKIPGVLGSRLTGGGFGGATISLVEHDAADAVAARLAADYHARMGAEGKAYLCESADGAT
jgi:galactokinase